MYRRLAISVGLAIVLAPLAWAGSSGDTNVGVNNVAPEVTSVVVNDGDDVSLQPGAETEVPVSVTVNDENGWQDVASFSVEARDAAGNVLWTASADVDDDCDGAGTTVTCDLLLTIPYWAEAGTYYIYPTGTDASGDASGVCDNPGDGNFGNGGDNGNDDNNGVDDGCAEGDFQPVPMVVLEMIAISLDPGRLDFGALDPGQLSDVLQLDVYNRGNVEIGIMVEGTDLDHATQGVSIPAANLAYDVSDTMSAPLALSADPATLDGFVVAVGANSSEPLFWQLDTPSGDEMYMPAGTYEGTVTITAISTAA